MIGWGLQAAPGPSAALWPCDSLDRSRAGLAWIPFCDPAAVSDCLLANHGDASLATRVAFVRGAFLGQMMTLRTFSLLPPSHK